MIDFRRITLTLLGLAWSVTAVAETIVLVEAESFAKLGGWVIDQQAMDQMGSPYLLAHGLGNPVADAETTVAFPATGTGAQNQAVYRLAIRASCEV